MDSRVKVEEKIFSTRPDEVWVRVVCENCNNSINTSRYSRNEWEEYMKEHFEVRHTNYCSECGAKLYVD